MNDKGIVVDVEIFGQVYPIKANVGSESYIRKVAGYIDDKMKEIHQVFNSSTDTKVAILAALNVADELFTLMDSHEEELHALKQKLSRYNDALDRALKE